MIDCDWTIQYFTAVKRCLPDLSLLFTTIYSLLVLTFKIHNWIRQYDGNEEGELGLGNGDITQKKKAEERDNKDTIVEQNLMDEKTSDGDDFDDLNITPRPQYICLVCLLPCTCWFNLQPSFLLTSQVTFFLTIIIIIIIITVVAMHCHHHHDCHQGIPS